MRPEAMTNRKQPIPTPPIKPTKGAHSTLTIDLVRFAVPGLPGCRDGVANDEARRTREYPQY